MIGRWEKLFMIVISLWGILRCIIARPRVMVFGNDRIGMHSHEPRLSKIYHWLESHQVPYAHMVHAAPRAHVVQHWLRRHGPIVYLEGLEAAGISLAWFFHVVGARHLWGIDDFRYWPRVIASARQASLRSVLFQHGRFNRHMTYLSLPNHMPLPDHYIVWNEYWRTKLLQLSAPFAAHPAVVVVGGKPSWDAMPPHRSVPALYGPLHIVVVHEPAAQAADVQFFLDSLLSLQDISVSYKVRGDQPIQDQLVALGLEKYSSRGMSVVSDVPPDAQLVLGSYSTLLYEAVAQGLPVGVVTMKSMEADDLVTDGLAVSIDPHASDLSRQLVMAADVPAKELARRAQHLAVTADLGDTLSRML
jgi:hypothetical protein